LTKSETRRDPESEVSETQSDVESENHDSHSNPSLDSGIILKPSKLEEVYDAAGTVNISFENEIDTAL